SACIRRPQRRAAPSKVSPLGGQRPASAVERGGFSLRKLGLAGSRPGGRPSFFCFAKRKKAKKRRAGCAVPSLRYGHTALLGPDGVCANLSAARPSDMRSPDPPGPALLASA